MTSSILRRIAMWNRLDWSLTAIACWLLMSVFLYAAVTYARQDRDPLAHAYMVVALVAVLAGAVAMVMSSSQRGHGVATTIVSICGIVLFGTLFSLAIHEDSAAYLSTLAGVASSLVLAVCAQRLSFQGKDGA